MTTTHEYTFEYSTTHMDNFMASNRHQDQLLHELQQEVMELRARQGDMTTIREQISYNQNQFNSTQSEKNRNDQECSKKLYEGLQVIDQLVAELDEFRHINRVEEEHQTELLYQLSQTCADHDSKQAQLRESSYQLQTQENRNQVDSRELDGLKNEVSNALQVRVRQTANFDSLQQQCHVKTNANEASQIQCKSMRSEIEAQQSRISHQRDLEQRKCGEIKKVEENLHQANNEIVTLQYELKNLDNEICYFEESSKKLTESQDSLKQVLEYTVRTQKELQVNEKDSSVGYRNCEDDLAQVERELQIMKSKNDTQCDISNSKQKEIEALNRHIQVLTSQNQEFSSELNLFLRTDEVVKTRLNRREAVDEIRHKVDTAIRRSMNEIDQRRSSPVRSPNPRSPHMVENRSPLRYIQKENHSYAAICHRQTTDGPSRRSASTNATMTLAAMGYYQGKKDSRKAGNNSPLRSKSPINNRMRI